ncbi:hypothetical protein HXY33_06445 [Candidatus Bathyarchaeota archaeon]|nr:hypothetical protein [Candidatus Bathyarchaeota archaeon]
MGCWKWFNSILKEAGVEATDESKTRIDDVIHKYINEQISCSRCSPNWSKAKKQVQENEQMKRELVQKLKALL